ncbi:hypothetical protein EYF80_036697 [Liparis tanakae]|uniref:Uncharacterized protein n=1 Tax=Liparis tanakae TaxID=230148 RepID=A0A4Z2GIP5_9TELE|nr:hypothetical protein EYF80_036697 [Liparis tanakae]
MENLLSSYRMRSLRDTITSYPGRKTRTAPEGRQVHDEVHVHLLVIEAVVVEFEQLLLLGAHVGALSLQQGGLVRRWRSYQPLEAFMLMSAPMPSSCSICVMNPRAAATIRGDAPVSLCL